MSKQHATAPTDVRLYIYGYLALSDMQHTLLQSSLFALCLLSFVFVMLIVLAALLVYGQLVFVSTRT